MNAIEISGLHHSFGGAREALRGLSLQIPQGELFGLLGPDGAGKTTLLRLLAGVVAVQKGSVRVFAQDPSTDGGALRSLVGYMPQRYSLYGDLTVGENLRFFGDLFGLTKAQFRDRTERLLGITRLERFADRRADALSGGMYKKLALSCALLHEPQVLLLDEPTNGVDPVSRRELWALLKEFSAQGMTIVVSTSYMDEATLCSRVMLLHEGVSLLDGAPPTLLEGFSSVVLRVGVSGAAADDILAPLASHIVAQTPLGKGTRVVVSSSSADFVCDHLEKQGIVIQRMTPSFEDLFLEIIHEQTSSAHTEGGSS